VEGMGKAFYLKIVGIVLGVGIVAFLGFLLFSRAVYRFGLIGGVVIVAGILMLIAWRYDTKQHHKYDDEE